MLTVFADRAGRLWRVAEVCARCAAATSGCRVLDTAAAPSHSKPEVASVAGGRRGVPAAAAVFSAPGPSSTAGAVPAARGHTGSEKTARRVGRSGKIAQRIVPPHLKPDDLRTELIELGDAYRAYQKREEPDLVLLAALHERKAHAFQRWAEVTGDGSLWSEAKRAEQAAQTTRVMHAHRVARLPAVLR
ncbi:hypothetical protein [Streptomyces alkaliterrae]|uniref:Uncharacterized protein n=1 Tax=Streptomyces alkaliterrae TaxID=2213162 RepID=A0A7W3WTR3_9ACTN|nr:hypothetical protein [Streptomyces alkaliterrae]MBB1258329.1 hypothetical protein [Streptomyces alkaliterrae]